MPGVLCALQAATAGLPTEISWLLCVSFPVAVIESSDKKWPGGERARFGQQFLDGVYHEEGMVEGEDGGCRLVGSRE